MGLHILGSLSMNCLVFCPSVPAGQCFFFFVYALSAVLSIKPRVPCMLHH